jgi:hypothetical protein
VTLVLGNRVEEMKALNEAAGEEQVASNNEK